MVEIARKNDNGSWDSNIVGVLGKRIHSYSLNNLLEAIYHKEKIREFNIGASYLTLVPTNSNTSASSTPSIVEFII